MAQTPAAAPVSSGLRAADVSAWLTGLGGQVGPLQTADEVRDRVQLDIEYIERQSFWLDLWIIAVTVPVRRGDRMAVR